MIVARAKGTPDGVTLSFEEAYARRVAFWPQGIALSLPCIEDLIITKRWAMRPKDMLAINFLDSLRAQSK